MNRNRGFSLVEVVCALLILSVGLLGMTEGLTTALRSSKEAEVQTGAALLAAGLVEELRAETFLYTEESEGQFGEGLSQYRWSRSVTSTTIDGLFEVVVVVAENSASGRAIYELTTLLFDPPLISSLESSSDYGGEGSSGRRSGSSRRRGRGRP